MPAVLFAAALMNHTRFLTSEILAEVMLQGGEVVTDVIQVLIGGKSLGSASSSATDSRCDLELLPVSSPSPHLHICNNNSSPFCCGGPHRSALDRTLKCFS